jgi:hypothetical protein
MRGPHGCQHPFTALLNGGGRCNYVFDDDGSCARGGVARAVGGDVVDRVRCFGVRVYDDVADELAVEESFDVEVDCAIPFNAEAGRMSPELAPRGHNRVQSTEG